MCHLSSCEFFSAADIFFTTFSGFASWKCSFFRLTISLVCILSHACATKVLIGRDGALKWWWWLQKAS